jgi:NitT/TauT family transport system substrate-binding protein
MMSRTLTALLLSIALLVAGCGKKEPAATAAAPGAPKLFKLRFQTDWYAQSEHGGFYQALAKGYYREAGLDVEINQGGPGPTVPQKIMGGAAEIGMFASDSLIINVNSGLPFVLIGATMQHDPQAVLVHEESDVKTFSDLNGKSIMANPGSNWLDYLKVRYQIDFKLIPMNYSLAQFMADKNFIQQCFITNEPFYAKKNGAKTRTLLIAGSGFDPYRAYATTQSFAREHPEIVKAFVAASTRGWEDFINNDPAPAKALIAKANPQMTEEFMDYSRATMKEFKLVEGDAAAGDRIGLLTKERLQQQVELLVKLKLLPAPIPVEKFTLLGLQPAR